jgi:hypothetical protein
MTAAEQWWPFGEQHRVAGVMRDVAGLRSTVNHAPFAVGDIIELTKGSDVQDSRNGPAYPSRGDQVRATACCQPSPRPSSARTARPISANVRVAKRGEPAGLHRAIACCGRGHGGGTESAGRLSALSAFLLRM